MTAAKGSRNTAPLPSGSARMSASVSWACCAVADLRPIGNPHQAQNRVEIGLASAGKPQA